MNQRIASTLSHAFTAAVLLLAVLAPGCEDPLVQPPPAQAIDSPEKVVAALSHAYQTRDARLFTSILANDADHNEVYLFLLSAPPISAKLNGNTPRKPASTSACSSHRTPCRRSPPSFGCKK